MKDNKFIRDTKLKLPIEFSSEDLNENYIGEVIFKDEDDRLFMREIYHYFMK